MNAVSTPRLYRPALVQAQHWAAACRRLEDLDALAGSTAWQGIGRTVMQGLRKALAASVQALERRSEQLLQQVMKGHAGNTEIESLKQHYLRVEMLLDFYADAIATRTSAEMCATLRACDYISEHSMRALLAPLGYVTPAVITYIDKGLGASIMKAGLRLWDDSENPVAAIKIVRHNLLRPTALVHEAGHQVAHLCDWNSELANLLRGHLSSHSKALAEQWAGWASEIAADVFAFVHTGFASVAALHDVVDGTSREVFRFIPGDPHPVSYLRVLTGIACCRQAFGNGVWNDMQASWQQRHQLSQARPATRQLITASFPILPEIARLLLYAPLKAFRGKSIAECIDVAPLHPQRLERTAGIYGPSFYTSAPLLVKAPLLRLAWNGYQLAVAPEAAQQHLDGQKAWMQLLGNSIQSPS